MQAKITFIEGKSTDYIQLLVFQTEPYQVILHKTFNYGEKDINTLRDLIETNGVENITYNGCHSFMDNSLCDGWLESRIASLAERI